MKKYIVLLFFTAIQLIANAQYKVSGKVSEGSVTLPFVNIFEKGTTNGTTSNMDGGYSLSVSSENATVVYRMVGFKQEEYVASKISQNIQLSSQALQLKEVKISSGRKDPAYGIIKKAMKKRKFYLNQVEEFSCNAYMKGRASILTVPEMFKKMAKEDSSMLDTGLLYLSESLSEYYFQKPNNSKETMLASKVSGSEMGFGNYSWNRADQIQLSFYEANIRLGANERGLVSPIAPTAMAHYDYKLEGFYEENGYLINKIKVIPKRLSDPVFIGEIYIIEDTWNIHSLNLKVRKEATMQNIDSLIVQQSYANVGDNVWMPLSVTSNYYFNLMGIKINYKALGQFNNYNVQPNFPKDFFSNQVFSVEDTAKQNNEEFWGEKRPTELTKEEEGRYVEGDSIVALISSKPYVDSVDRARNKFRAMDLVRGYNYSKTFDSVFYNTSGILGVLQFNSVDGIRLEGDVKVTKTKNGKKRWISPNVAYASKRKTWNGGLDYTIRMNKWNYATHYFSAYSGSRQINGNKPITPGLNTYYTYFEGRNFAKFMNEHKIQYAYTQEVYNGLRITLAAKYAYRESLRNNETAVFKNAKRQIYGPNLQAITNLNASTVLFVSMVYKHKQKYEKHGEKKVNLGSKYPTLRAKFIASVPSLGSTNFSYAEYGVSDNLNLRMLGSLKWKARYGHFLNAKKMDFADFKHFDGNQTAILAEGGDAFHRLPYYQFSTNKSYLHLQAEHHFNGMLMNKIPLIKKLKWQSLAGTNYLKVADLPQYAEVYFGIEGIFNVLRLDFSSSLIANKLGDFRIQLTIGL